MKNSLRCVSTFGGTATNSSSFSLSLRPLLHHRTPSTPTPTSSSLSSTNDNQSYHHQHHRWLASSTSSTATRERPRRISLEGNIAAGKSTFLALLQKSQLDFAVMQEPVTRWQRILPSANGNNGNNDSKTASSAAIGSEDSVPGGNLLDMFYRDPKRYAYTFQSYAFFSRLKDQMQPPPPSAHTPKYQLFERSVYSDRYCFGTNCYQGGLMDEVEWALYSEMHTFFCTKLATPLDAFIYLRTAPETCQERLKRRGRFEETTVSLDYLKSLHDKHEKWLIQHDVHDPVAKSIANVPILVLEADEEFERSPSRQDQHMRTIRDFLASLTGPPATGGNHGGGRIIV